MWDTWRNTSKHIYIIWLLRKKCLQKMKGHTLEQRLMTDFSFCLMTDRADNIVTKRGRSKKILLMRLQFQCQQEPFQNKVEWETKIFCWPPFWSVFFHFLEAFFHQTSDVHMLGFSGSIQLTPQSSQSKIHWGNVFLGSLVLFLML